MREETFKRSLVFISLFGTVVGFVFGSRMIQVSEVSEILIILVTMSVQIVSIAIVCWVFFTKEPKNNEPQKQLSEDCDILSISKDRIFR